MPWIRAAWCHRYYRLIPTFINFPILSWCFPSPSCKIFVSFFPRGGASLAESWLLFDCRRCTANIWIFFWWTFFCSNGRNHALFKHRDWKFREYETCHHAFFQVYPLSSIKQIMSSQEKSTPNHPNQSHPHETMSPFIFSHHYDLERVSLETSEMERIWIWALWGRSMMYLMTSPGPAPKICNSVLL